MAMIISESGMVTSVGLTAPASCAAMRGGISGYTETRFMFMNEWLMGCPVMLEEPWWGRDKLVHMTVAAVRECLSSLKNTRLSDIPLFLSVAEPDRPGRPADLNDQFLADVQSQFAESFHPSSAVFAQGAVGGVHALERARAALRAGRSRAIVAGADTFLVRETLEGYRKADRILAVDNSNGFVPGEAAAAVLVAQAARPGETPLRCRGIGFGHEDATIASGQPLRADGLVAAIQQALAEAAIPLIRFDYRITDLNGEQYAFKEATLALDRLLRERRELVDVWHPAESIGEVGAAIVPCALGVALTAARKAYAPGPGVLCHFANDGPERAAIALWYGKEGRA